VFYTVFIFVEYGVSLCGTKGMICWSLASGIGSMSCNLYSGTFGFGPSSSGLYLGISMFGLGISGLFSGISGGSSCMGCGSLVLYGMWVSRGGN
jgi:hypothetical protein